MSLDFKKIADRYQQEAASFFEKESFIREDWEKLDEKFEESAAILEYDAGRERYEAQQLAAQNLGFNNMADLKSHVQLLKGIG